MGRYGGSLGARRVRGKGQRDREGGKANVSRLQLREERKLVAGTGGVCVEPEWSHGDSGEFEGGKESLSASFLVFPAGPYPSCTSGSSPEGGHWRSQPHALRQDTRLSPDLVRTASPSVRPDGQTRALELLWLLGWVGPGFSPGEAEIARGHR